jgi:lipoprotein-anchoring transpeptidase ErfK/SrfK
MATRLFIVATCAVAMSAAASASAPQKHASNTKKPDMLAAQVLVDRAGFSPGEIDGAGGPNTQHAIAAFEREKKTTIAEALASASDPATIDYTITAEDDAMPRTPNIPEDMMEKTKLKRLDYSTMIEMLGERFHGSPALLKKLNPSSQFIVGETITVPNTQVVSTLEAKPIPNISVRVSKQQSTLTVTGPSGEVLMHAPVTSGSEYDPLPIGSWAVTAVVRNPPFNYNPDLFWDADPSHAKAKVPPGPNGPVGVVWIDISKPHYGLHGTPEPGTVGHTSSHGCVRLTNWDALRLAAMVGKGTKVEFVE